jgi:DNA-binding CsgD family transcriptional regulator
MPTNLSRSDLLAAMNVLQAIGEDCAGGASFARCGVRHLPRLVASEITTLSVCDLDSGHRTVVCDQPGAISRRELEVFDRYFFDHPLVNEHGRNPGAVTRRIADLLPGFAFERSALYNDYYRAIRIEHVMAVPIHVDRSVLVSFVVNRSKRGFSDRDRDCLEVIRPHLGHLYRISGRTTCSGSEPADSSTPLTGRESEVLEWLTAGKTDKDIAAILGISPRTVQKHSQKIYEKLGVETRTAAAMRAIATRH